MLDGCTPYPEQVAARYRREGYWRDETISVSILESAKRHPNAVAVADHGQRLTYTELIEDSGRIRSILRRYGIGNRDRVIVQLPNCVEFASVLIACLESGAIPVMALPAFRRAELEYLASLSQAKGIVVAPEYRGFDHAAMALDLKRVATDLVEVFTTRPAPGCVALDGAVITEGSNPAQVDAFDVALFLLSGGTTGLPKLIPRTHTDYLYNAREAANVCGLDGSSRILIVLPGEHNFPLSSPGLIGALLSGATAVFTQSPQLPDLVNVIASEKITHLPCVPTIAQSLLNLPKAERCKLKSLRVITVGGQRLQEPTARALREMMDGTVVQQVLGMAEGLLCFTRLDDPEIDCMGSQGRPISAADEIRIVDSSGLEVAEGEIGELWCRGPYTIRGYYRAPDKNAEAFTPDGFYRTGDLVRLTASGNLIVQGRIKDQINRGGEKIGAEEIESHLLAHSAVSSAAVVAMPDPTLGERACAFVTLRAGACLALDDVREFLDARGVARFKWPERLEVIEAMPLTNVGKIKKSELRSNIAARLASEKSEESGRT